jgi:hypothetical protein
MFKTRVLGLPSGTRSRNIALPPMLSGSFENQARFWSGYQYSDGSFYCQSMSHPVIKITSSSLRLIHSLQDFADLTGVDYSLGKDHPTVGYSLRICSERSLSTWIQRVPLLNPVHAARFLLWSSGRDCPPGLHFSQYMDLALGVQEVSEVNMSYCGADQIQRHYLNDTLQLVCIACIGNQTMTLDELRVSANLCNVEHAMAVSRDLFECGLATRTFGKKTSCIQLTELGQSRLAELRAFWSELTATSPAIAPFSSWKLEEGLSC